MTTDFEALYAYKHGEYQRCLQLSTQNVHTLIGARITSPVLAHSELIQFMDGDLVCVIGLMLLVDLSCRVRSIHIPISQLTLSLYLMTQCQMTLHYPVTSLAQTLHYVEVARRKLGHHCTLDQLMLKLTERNTLRCISVGI